MRKLLCALSLISALTFALAVHAAAPTSFAGSWMLDKSKSQGLNPRVQNAESVAWTIEQTDKTITIDEKITGGGSGVGAGAGPGGPPPGAAPGGGQGGPGRGMGGGMGGPRTFNLDGSETSGEMGPAKFVRKAALSSDGKTLELTSKTTFTRDGQETTLNSSDKLTLSGDGKTLTIVRHAETPRGVQDSTLVFTK